MQEELLQGAQVLPVNDTWRIRLCLILLLLYMGTDNDPIITASKCPLHTVSSMCACCA